MLFTRLPFVVVVVRLLVAVLGVPTGPLLDGAVQARSLTARSPVIKFHICTGLNFAKCHYLDTPLLTKSGSTSGCRELKPGVALNVKSIRVLDPWNYLVTIYDGAGCNGKAVSYLDSDDDIGSWKDRAKSVRVYYVPTPHNSWPESAVV